MNAKNDIATRSALLRYYSSECLSHSAYIFTLLLAFLGWIEIYSRFLDPFLKAHFLKMFILSVSISFFAFFGTYLVLRTLWWGYLTNAIVQMQLKQGGREDIVSLHQECSDYVRGKGKWKGRSTFGEKISSISSGRKMWWVIFWIILLGFFLVMGIWLMK